MSAAPPFRAKQHLSAVLLAVCRMDATFNLGNAIILNTADSPVHALETMHKPNNLRRNLNKT